jgi:hypothetical protein
MIVGFSKPNKFKIGSMLIRAWMGFSPFSHAYLRFWSNKYQLWMVYEASHGDIHFEEWENWKTKNKIVKEFDVPVSQEKETETVKWCILQCQKPYSFKALLLIPFGYTSEDIDGDGEADFVCHKFAAKAMGLPVNEYATPKDLYIYAENNLNVAV